MTLFEYLAIVVVAMLVYSAWLTKHLSKSRSHAQRQAELPQCASPREAELEGEIEELRERLHVLERIAVDGRETGLLSDEIEKLRDR